MTKWESSLPEKVLIYGAARGTGKTFWVEEMKRKALDEGKTVLVIRKRESNAKRHN